MCCRVPGMELSFLGLPQAFVDDNALTLKGNAHHVPRDMAQAPDGTVWVLSRLLYFELGTRRSFDNYFLSTYSRDGEHRWTREVSGLQQAIHGPGDSGATLHEYVAVDAQGQVIVTTTRNLTFVYSPDLELRASYAVNGSNLEHESLTAPTNFAATIDVLPSGRFLCAIGEHVGGFHVPSIVALSDEVPQLVTGRPTLRYVTSLRPASEYARYLGPERKGVYPYVLLDGAPFQHEHRPLPTLGDCADRSMGLDTQRCTRLRALDEDHFVASYAQHVLRSMSGLPGNYWGFACCNARGELLEHVDLSGHGTDHPFAPKDWPQYDYATLPGAGAITVKNRSAAYFVRFGGELRRVDLTEKPHKPLSPLRIVGATREGRQVLYHDKHRTLMWLDPILDGDDFERSLSEAAGAYRKAFNQVKKACPPEDGYFVV